MDEKLDSSFKNTFVRFDIQLMDVYIELARDYFSYLIQQPNSVYTFNIYIYREVECFTNFPLYSQQSISKATFQLSCYRTLTFVDDNSVIVVNVAQYVITGNRLTAVGYDVIFLNGIRGNLYNFLAVNFRCRCFFLLFFFIILTAAKSKRYIFFPVSLCRFFF